VVWSLVVAVVLLVATVPRGWWARFRSRRSLILVGVAAAVVSVNWGVYIWAVNSGQVVETSLGYYINPILSILVGVIALGERLSTVQWVSVGLAAVAVVVLTVEYGRLPWIALTLAVSFATYGVVKKQLNAGAVETLTLESAYLAPLAIGYLIYLQVTGAATFGALGWTYNLLLAATGLVTAVPLLFFAASATRLPLSTLGLLQYLAPTLTFLLGLLYFGEQMSAGRWVGFGLVWIALMILTGHGLYRANLARRGRTVSSSRLTPATPTLTPLRRSKICRCSSTGVKVTTDEAPRHRREADPD
jgi:chloramphenicol-sensitive protein RarD